MRSRPCADGEHGAGCGPWREIDAPLVIDPPWYVPNETAARLQFPILGPAQAPDSAVILLAEPPSPTASARCLWHRTWLIAIHS